jgi:hypothetical protein
LVTQIAKKHFLTPTTSSRFQWNPRPTSGTFVAAVNGGAVESVPIASAASAAFKVGYGGSGRDPNAPVF